MRSNPEHSTGITPKRREDTESEDFVVQRMTLRIFFSLVVVLLLTFFLIIIRISDLLIFVYDLFAVMAILIIMSTAGSFMDRILLTGCLQAHVYGLRSGALIQESDFAKLDR